MTDLNERLGRLDALKRAAERIADHTDPLGVEARDQLEATTGLSKAGVEYALRECLEHRVGRSALSQLARRTGCGLLLDINNAFVSATNHGASAMAYLAEFPLAHVGEIHLAGHVEQADDEGDPLLIDSHDRPVTRAVWDLFETVIGRCGPIPTLIEWDSELPEWGVLKAEAAAAQQILDRHAQPVPGEAHAA